MFYLLLRGIPEQIAVVNLAFVTNRIPIKFCSVLLIGSVLAFANYLIMYFVTLFHIPFGINILILITLLFISLIQIKGKEDIGLSFIACMGSYLSLMIFDYICLLFFRTAFEVTPDTLSPDSFVEIALTVSKVFLLLISAFVFKRFYLIRGKKTNEY
jgi:hypothetical protein